MKVSLRTNWFGPDGFLYRSNRNPHTFPDDWKSQIPKSAKVEILKVEDDEDLPPPAKK